MSVHQINEAPPQMAAEMLQKCCGASRWVAAMVEQRPFSSTEELLTKADELWWSLEEKDWLEAFSQHPMIGDIESLRARFANTKGWASREQSGCEGASEDVLQGLAAGNAEYRQKFGYIFIVCATGKSADEMLLLLNHRLHNTADSEIRVAAKEQAKITKLRLEKLCEEVPSQPMC